MDVLAQGERQNSPFLHFLNCVQALNGLDVAHSHWGEQSALYSSPIHMLTSLTLTDGPRNNIYKLSGYHSAQSWWQKKISHHKHLTFSYVFSIPALLFSNKPSTLSAVSLDLLFSLPGTYFPQIHSLLPHFLQTQLKWSLIKEGSFYSSILKRNPSPISFSFVFV